MKTADEYNLLQYLNDDDDLNTASNDKLHEIYAENEYEMFKFSFTYEDPEHDFILVRNLIKVSVYLLTKEKCIVSHSCGQNL